MSIYYVYVYNNIESRFLSRTSHVPYLKWILKRSSFHCDFDWNLSAASVTSNNKTLLIVIIAMLYVYIWSCIEGKITTGTHMQLFSFIDIREKKAICRIDIQLYCYYTYNFICKYSILYKFLASKFTFMHISQQRQHQTCNDI